VPRAKAKLRATTTDSPLDRDRLVAVAADLADRDGWLQLSLSQVAREVDRHVTSLYGHVDGLDGLRRAVALLALQELGDVLWRAALGRSGADALESLAIAYRDYVRRHPGRSASLLAADPSGDEEMTALQLRSAEPAFATFQSFGLDRAAAVHANRIFAAAVRGFAIAEVNGVYRGDAESANTTFKLLVQLFITGLESGAWPA